MQYRSEQPYSYALIQTPIRKVSWSKRRQKTLASRIPPSASDVSQSQPPTAEPPPVFPRLASLVTIGDRTPDEVHTCTRMLRLIHEIRDSDLPSDRVVSTRLAVADGTYENALKIEIAVDRLLADLEALPEPLTPTLTPTLASTLGSQTPSPVRSPQSHLPPLNVSLKPPLPTPPQPVAPTPTPPPTPTVEIFTSPRRHGLPLPPHTFSF